MSPTDDLAEGGRLDGLRHRLLVEGIEDEAVFLVEPDGRVASWNAGARRLTGYAADEVIGRHIDDLRAGGSAAGGEMGRLLAAASASGRAELVGWWDRRDGSRVRARAVAWGLADRDGRPIGFGFLLREPPGRDENDVALRSVVDHVVDGIITIDECGLVHSFNPAAEALFGYPAPEVLGRNVRMLMPEPHHSQHDGYLAEYVRTGRPKIIGIGREVEGLRRNGSTFPMDLAVSEFRLDDRRYFTGIVRDITERRRLETELRGRVAELAEADRRKDEFLAMLAHELRNPLAVISSAVQFVGLRDDPAEDDPDRDVIRRQIRHLTRLIDDLLDVSRISRGKIQLRKEPVEVGPILTAAAAAARPLLDARGHALTVDLPAAPLWVDADATRLDQILGNLLNNAAKYTPNGGRIRLSAAAEGGEVVLRVADTGIGIPADQLSAVFEPFAQGDRSLARSEGGLGIGLTLARSLAELHGGSVVAASEGTGWGSEFVVRLPASAGTRAKADAGGGPRPGSARARVLVVDDNVDLARNLARLLKLIGHEVRLVHDGVLALDEARAFRPDVVLLDIGLPRLDGYQVARLLREEEFGRDARIIAVTGYGGEEDRKRSREAGFDEHLVKPVEFQSLVGLLARNVA